MELVRGALECGEQFERLITISGMDYPVWSKEQIVQFFEQDREKEYLAAIDCSYPWHASAIYQQYFFWVHKPGSGWKYYVTRALGRTLRLLGVKKPLRRKIGDKTYKLYKGAAWWAITPELAKVIFAQTVAFNDESWKEKCIEHRGKKWGLPLLTPLTYIEWRERGLIVELDEAYYDRIIQSGKMFCRKIVSGKSDALVEMIKKV